MHGLMLAVAAFTSRAQGPLHYKVESSVITDVDMSGMGMATQHIVVKSIGRISVTLSDTTGGKLAQVVVDSIDFDGGEMLQQAIAMGSIPPEAAASGKGATIHCYLPSGSPPSCNPPSTPAISAASLMSAFPILFAGIKSTAKVGDARADATSGDTTIATPGLGNMAGKVTTETKWKATAQSGKDLVLEAATTGTLTATIPGGAGTMEMTTTGMQHLVGSPGRPMHEATATNKATGKLTMMGSAIPVTATSTITIVGLP